MYLSCDIKMPGHMFPSLLERGGGKLEEREGRTFRCRGDGEKETEKRETEEIFERGRGEAVISTKSVTMLLL